MSDELCARCDHPRRLHWLRGGEVSGTGRKQSPYAWHGGSNNGTDPRWPEYYRAECGRSWCDCPIFELSPGNPQPVHKKNQHAEVR